MNYIITRTSIVFANIAIELKTQIFTKSIISCFPYIAFRAQNPPPPYLLIKVENKGDRYIHCTIFLVIFSAPVQDKYLNPLVLILLSF